MIKITLNNLLRFDWAAEYGVCIKVGRASFSLDITVRRRNSNDIDNLNAGNPRYAVS